MLNAKLIVVGGEAKAGEFQLRLPCQIGRGKQATLTLPHHLVSRKHCEISERDGRLVVCDLGSMNGTYINNHKIEAESILEPGQLLTMAPSRFVRFMKSAMTFRLIRQNRKTRQPPWKQSQQGVVERPCRPNRSGGTTTSRTAKQSMTKKIERVIPTRVCQRS